MPINRKPLRALAAAAFLAALAACADQPEPTAAGAPRLAEADATASDTIVSPPEDGDLYPGEWEFVELSKEIPGFAGYHYEEETRVVSLTDLSQQDAARAALDARKPEPGTEDDAFTGETRFVQARYDYPTLRAWRDDSAEGVLGVDGVTFLDLDEARNRVVVGIVDEKSRPGVEERLKEAGVPLEAAIVEVTGEVVQDTWLTAYQRPLESGWQIQNNNWALPCTLGFIYSHPVLGRVFTTASHCTNVMWQLEYTPFFQPTPSPSSNLAGREIRDPAGWSCGFLWKCRWSDAALMSTATTSSPGQIADALWGTPWTTAGPASSYTTLGYASPPLVGWPVRKVGRQSGLTAGAVAQTCVTVALVPKWLLCQYSAHYNAGAGDSGASVFTWNGNPSNLVVVRGLHWGRIGNRSWFSPVFHWNGVSNVGGIRADLGVP